MRPEVDLIDSHHFSSAGSAQLVHSLPKRVRLRLAPEDFRYGRRLEARLRTHPAVTSVSWCGPIRSLTVRFDPSLGLDQLLESLPD
jgi:hypothetical protein